MKMKQSVTRKLAVMFLAVAMLVGVFGCREVAAQTKSELDLYQEYVNKLSNKGYYDIHWQLFDINQDGIDECLITYLPSQSSHRTDGIICTVKKGKTVKLKKFTGGVSFHYKTGKKIVVNIDYGGYYNKFITYKLSGGTLKRVVTYKSDYNYNSGKVVYKKNSTKISENAFVRYMDSLTYLL